MALRKGQLCHYQCGSIATTWDHIVAKAWLPKQGIPMREHQKNKIPCCGTCNLLKAAMRSDCNCYACLEAWRIMGPYILPRTKKDIPLIEIVKQNIMDELLEDEEYGA